MIADARAERMKRNSCGSFEDDTGRLSLRRLTTPIVVPQVSVGSDSTTRVGSETRRKEACVSDGKTQALSRGSYRIVKASEAMLRSCRVAEDSLKYVLTSLVVSAGEYLVVRS